MLAHAHRAGVDRLDAQLLLAHVLQCSRSWLLAHDDASLSERQDAQVAHLIGRRATGEPLAYLTGEKEFHGLKLVVSPAVLIPRPDTETLVDWALELLERCQPAPRVLDLGTGSGAIALAIKHRCPDACVTAADVSSEALALAQLNAQRLGLDVRFLQSDWWNGVGREQFHVVVSNPPYIALGDEHLPALRHEPELALTSGKDGLDALKAIVAGATEYLVPHGWLLLEHGHDQAAHVQRLLLSQSLGNVETRQDLTGTDRCTGGQWG